MELAPCHPHDPPSLGLQSSVAGTVPLERCNRVVRAPAVQLDDESGGTPHEVALDPTPPELEADVDFRAGQVMGTEEGEKAVLELAAGGRGANACIHQDRSERGGAAAARMAGEEVVYRDREAFGAPS
jgi:hypothetical protein